MNSVATIYGAYNKDDNVRLKSSSGGIFHALAKCIIAEGGIVYGAVLERKGDSFICHHQRCNSIAELESLLGSKYLQSSLGNTFCEIKELLTQNRTVLFCGTPCQVSGLKSYLGNSYNNLFLIDFVCHGVPKKQLLEKVISEEGTAGLSAIEFRNKKFGWQNYSFALFYENGNSIYRTRYECDFMKLYLTNAYLRPSCYKCRNKQNYHSDITLGDFWGIEKYKVFSPEDLQKGMSIMVVNSEKGHLFLEKMKDDLFTWSIGREYFQNANISYRESSLKPFDWKKLNRMLDTVSSKEIMQYYMRYNEIRTLIYKVFRKLSKWLCNDM